MASLDISYNDIYQYVIESKDRVIIIYGGRDSGKSFFVGGQYLPLKMIETPGIRIVAMRDTYASCKDSVYKEILDGIASLNDLSSQFSTTKQPLEIRHKNGSEVIFRGADDPSKIKSLKGVSIIWREEAENMTEKEYYDLLILLRGKGEQKLILTFNPVDEDFFANAMFTDTLPEKVLEKFSDGEKKVWTNKFKHMIDGEEVIIDALVICSTFDDNYFIPPIRKAVIEELKDRDPYLYEVYRKGRYGKKGGRIFTHYQEVDFEEKGWKFENFDNRGYSQDWGYNHASATMWIAEKDNDLYIFDEIYEFEKDTDEYEAIMRSKGVNKKTLLISESAEPDRVKTLKKLGYNIREVNKYAGSVKAQIDKVKRYNHVYINVTCKNTLKEIKAYTWKMDKQGKFTDEPITVYDDLMACLRYGMDLFEERTQWGWK